MNKRNATIDIAKGLGIVFVVYGHILLSGSLHNIICLFHMPLFFFISGYVISDKHNFDLKNYTISRVKRLYVPYVLIMAFLLIFHNGLLKIHFYDANELWYGHYELVDIIKGLVNIIFMRRLDNLAGPCWFIQTLFLIQITYIILIFFIRKLDKKKQTAIIGATALLFFMIGIGLSIWGIKLPYKLDTACFAFAIMLSGKIIRDTNDKIYENPYIFIISCVIFALVAFCGTNTEMSTHTYSNVFMSLLGMYSGIVVILNLSKYIGKIKAFRKFFTLLGKRTLSILMFHLLCFKIVILLQILVLNESMYKLSYTPVFKNGIIWNLLYLVVGIMIPLAISILWEAVKRRVFIRKGQVL